MNLLAVVEASASFALPLLLSSPLLASIQLLSSSLWWLHFLSPSAVFSTFDGAYICGRFTSPKSGNVTRCVNVVDNLGFPQVCMDNQHEFVDNTML